MTGNDQRLAAALTLVCDQLPHVIDEFLAGEVGPEDRHALAHAFRTVARALAADEPATVVVPAQAPRPEPSRA